MSTYGGRWLNISLCGSCKNNAKPPTYFCAYHQSLLCTDCVHHSCDHSLAALWRIDDNTAGGIEPDTYDKHVATIAVLQLTSPYFTLHHEYLRRITENWMDPASAKNKLDHFDVACHGWYGVECRTMATSFCSSCSQMACKECLKRHASDCKIWDVKMLKMAWTTFLERAGLPNAASVREEFLLVSKGTPAQKKEKLRLTEYRNAILAAVENLENQRFFGAADYIRQVFLMRGPQESALTVAGPVLNSEQDAKRKQAQTLLRSWEFVAPGERAKIFKQIRLFVYGEGSLEDAQQDVRNQGDSSSSAKRFELPPNTSDHVARELLLVASTFYKTASKLKLENLVWQDFRAEEHLKEMIVDQSLPQAKLIWLDPFYQERFQPKLSQPNESILMRGLLDAVSMDGTVVLVFGRPNLLFRYWAEPVFGDGVNSSKVRWFVDPSLFIVQRSKLRDKHTRNNRVWHSMTEYVLTVTRVPHVKSKSKGSREPMLALPQSRKYTTTFANKYGPDNGKPSNFYANYEPPTQSPDFG